MTTTVESTANAEATDGPELTSPWRTEARIELQQRARDFAAREVMPLANELDKRKGEIPYDFLQRLGELGYFGILVGTEHGGMGLGVFEYCSKQRIISDRIFPKGATL